MNQLLPSLQGLTRGLTQEFAQIPQARQELLKKLADYISLSVQSRSACKLNFICTHNSRRSHLGQIWAVTAAHYYDIPGVTTFSGGTESTALNPRMAAAFARAGFDIASESVGIENPVYSIRFADTAPAQKAWSKVYDDPANPQEQFAAVMTCDHADQNCPFVPGAERRFSLTYEDPKVADNTPSEKATYDERLRQIGRELLLAFSLVTTPAG